MASLRYIAKVFALSLLFALPFAMVIFVVLRMHMLSDDVSGFGGWFQGFRP